MFLGAGASAHYGYPTTKALKEELLKSVPVSPTNIEYKLLKSNHLYDIEYVLDLLIKFDQFFGVDHIHKFFSDMVIH